MTAAVRSAGRSTPLNPAQLAIWVNQQVTTEPGLYVEHVCYDILGELDESRFDEAVRDALAAHPAFGAAVLVERGVPRLVLGQYPIDVQRHPVTEADAATLLARASMAGPTPAGGPLSRCVVLEVSHRHRILLLVCHHLVTDGVGIRVFLRTLADRWANGVVAPGSGGDIRAANESLLAVAASADTRDRAEHIASRFLDLDPLPLPRRTDVPDHSCCVAIDEATGAVPGLAAAAVAARVTVPMLLNAAYQRAVGEVLGLREFLLGCVTTGRTTPESADVVGCFVNTVLQRANGDPTTPLAQLLRTSGLDLADAIGDQDVPFGAVAVRLLRAVDPRPTTFPQLYLSMDAPLLLELAGLQCRRRWIRHPQAKFDVALVVEFTTDGVQGTLHYSRAVLAPATAADLVAAFLARLRDLVVAGPRLRHRAAISPNEVTSR
jgi:hypothetical protein